MAVDNFIEEHPPWQRLLSSISSGSIEVEALTVTENGTYSEEGKAYSPVTVNVSGGATVGALTEGLVSTDEVAVDSDINAHPPIMLQVKIGNSVVIDLSSSYMDVSQLASGVDAVVELDALTFVKAYDITENAHGTKYVTVEEIDIGAENVTIEIDGETVQALEYTVPTLEEGHTYILYCTEQS